MAKKKDTIIIETFPWKDLMPSPVVGIDEVGRGCLAGPVYAAAAVVPLEVEAELLAMGVTDSKLLSSEKRERLAIEIRRLCLVSVGIATVDEIDQINILQASFLAMRRALFDLETLASKSQFGQSFGHFIVDGHQRIPLRGVGCDGFAPAALSRLAKVPQTTIVKGDLRALPIAAASIVAKVARDEMMTTAATEFPQYGFEKHKGYAAPIHRQAIAEHGPTRIHRKTFGGVREFLHLANF